MEDVTKSKSIEILESKINALEEKIKQKDELIAQLKNTANKSIMDLD